MNISKSKEMIIFYYARPPNQQLSVKASEMSFSSCKHHIIWCLTSTLLPVRKVVISSKKDKAGVQSEACIE